MPIHLITALSIGLTTPPTAFKAPAEQPRPSLLLVESQTHPEISLQYWTRNSDQPTTLTGTRPYSADAFRTHLGDNVEAFVAVGGTRLSKSAGHPKGAIIKAGFYKKDPAAPWFPRIDTSKPITVTMSGVAFNQPVMPQLDTIFQHCKFAPEDLESCGLPGSARECFNLVSTTDDLNGRTDPGVDTRMGAFNASESDITTASTERLTDTTVAFSLSFAYPQLRNLQDPWKSDLPGTFLEPIHFHIEMEVLPVGVEPLDWETLKRNAAVLQERLTKEGAIGVSGTALPPDAPKPAENAPDRIPLDFGEEQTEPSVSPEEENPTDTSAEPPPTHDPDQTDQDKPQPPENQS